MLSSGSFRCTGTEDEYIVARGHSSSLSLRAQKKRSIFCLLSKWFLALPSSCPSSAQHSPRKYCRPIWWLSPRLRGENSNPTLFWLRNRDKPSISFLSRSTRSYPKCISHRSIARGAYSQQKWRAFGSLQIWSRFIRFQCRALYSNEAVLMSAASSALQEQGSFLLTKTEAGQVGSRRSSPKGQRVFISMQ